MIYWLLSVEIVSFFPGIVNDPMTKVGIAAFHGIRFATLESRFENKETGFNW